MQRITPSLLIGLVAITCVSAQDPEVAPRPVSAGGMDAAAIAGIPFVEEPAAPVVEEKFFRVYPLVDADLTSSREAVEVILEEMGTVVEDASYNRLLVNTTAKLHARIADLLGEVMVKPSNVRIDVAFTERGSTRDTGAALHGDGRIEVGGGKTSGGLTLRPELRHTTTRHSRNVVQFLLAQSGGEAMLRIGEQVPYMNWLFKYGRQWGYIEGSVAWHNVGSYLVVRPTVLDDGKMVRVQVTPGISGYVDGSLMRTEVARVSTEVTVANGETVSIGGLTKDEEFYSRFLVGFDSSGNRQTIDITLTPRVVDPTLPGLP